MLKKDLEIKVKELEAENAKLKEQLSDSFKSQVAVEMESLKQAVCPIIGKSKEIFNRLFTKGA